MAGIDTRFSVFLLLGSFEYTGLALIVHDEDEVVVEASCGDPEDGTFEVGAFVIVEEGAENIADAGRFRVDSDARRLFFTDRLDMSCSLIAWPVIWQ
jgi:hypothetical protein